jgi:hypothetical protein
VGEAVAALKAKAERGVSGVALSPSNDPVVVLAYGLGAWPSGADLTSLEELLGELGVSHDVLRNRFESLLRDDPDRESESGVPRARRGPLIRPRGLGTNRRGHSPTRQ